MSEIFLPGTPIEKIIAYIDKNAPRRSVGA
jgi:hypothetical protein